MAKNWIITGSFGAAGGVVHKRLTFKTKESFECATTFIASKEGPGPHLASDDYTNIIIWYTAQLIVWHCAEIWDSAEGDTITSREIQLAADQFKKQLGTRAALISGAERRS